MVGASIFVGLLLTPSAGWAAAAWSPTFTVVSGAGAVTEAQVWAAASGHVAVTWSSTGDGPAGAWVRTYDPASGWIAPVRVSTNILTAPAVHSAGFARNGNLVVAYASDTGTPGLSVSTYTPGLDLVRLDTMASGTETGLKEAELVKAGTGDLALVWSVNQTSGSAIFVSWLYAGGDWSAPSRIDGANSSIFDMDATSFDSNEIAVGWMETVGKDQSVIVRRVPAGANVIPPSQRVSTPHNFSVGSLALADTVWGGFIAAWVETAPSGGGGDALLASRLLGDSPWSEPWTAPAVIVEAEWVGAPQMPGGLSGHPVVVWAQRMEGGTVTCFSEITEIQGPANWTPPAPLHEGGGASFAPAIVPLRDGAAITAWFVENEEGISLWGGSYQSVSTMKEVEPLQGALGNQTSPPSLSADDRGVTWVAFVRAGDGQSAVQVQALGMPASEDISPVPGSSTSSPLGGLIVPLAIGGVAVVAVLWVWRRPS